jgi:hypothetical protein
LFQDTWGEIGAGISLYIAGIVKLIIESLSSNSWAMKKQAAKYGHYALKLISSIFMWMVQLDINY